MPIISVYQHGSTSGTPPMRNDHDRAKRQNCKGWSPKTARSNTAFLRSVVLDDLNGIGFAFTLTLKNCPETHADWHKLRRSMELRLRRMGMLRIHWVTEWQRRGVPHLHGVVYFPESIENGHRIPSAIIDHWLSAGLKYSCRPQSQNVKPITDSLGWLKYLAKHASRGAHHYQRASENIPKGWENTGRMWGKVGTWPTAEPMKFELTREGNFSYRRVLRNYRISLARNEGNPRSITAARSMLKSNTRNHSEVRGTSAWVPEGVSLSILAYLASSGFDVRQ